MSLVSPLVVARQSQACAGMSHRKGSNMASSLTDQSSIVWSDMGCPARSTSTACHVPGTAGSWQLAETLSVRQIRRQQYNRRNSTTGLSLPRSVRRRHCPSIASLLSISDKQQRSLHAAVARDPESHISNALSSSGRSDDPVNDPCAMDLAFASRLRQVSPHRRRTASSLYARVLRFRNLRNEMAIRPN